MYSKMHNSKCSAQFVLTNTPVYTRSGSENRTSLALRSLLGPPPVTNLSSLKETNMLFSINTE